MTELRKPEIIPVNDHVWLLNDNSQATCYVVAGTRQAMVIDTSIGMCNIREAAESLTDMPLILVNTHGHGDHMGGNWCFDKAYMNQADVPIAEESLKWPGIKEAIKHFGLVYPPYEHTEDGHIFDLGGIELEVMHFPGHTPGEIILLDRKDRIIFSGDGIIEHIWLQLPHSLPIRVQIESMERLKPIIGSFDTILHGHCQSPVGIELYHSLLAALYDLEAGNTQNDTDYDWDGFKCRSHPYQPGNREIIYK
ncbi:MAG: MBL fold metallo-hydrolase [Lachnospiraceae bacterium]|nr:MBL fold metallo-hydrolase [Lachnospiraceae bacterium]